MPLTVERAGADDFGKWINMLVCAEPGAGKTRTASTWPNVLYANCEGGMMAVADRQTPSIKIKTSADMLELKTLLEQPPTVREKMLGFPVDTICLDTLDEYGRILMRERLEAEKKEAFAQPDWGWYGDKLRDLVRALRNLEMNLIINCHLKATEDSETGRVFSKPMIPGAMGEELPGYVDLALLLKAKSDSEIVEGKNVRVIKRWLQTYPDLHSPWVKDRSGRLDFEVPINFEDDGVRIYEAIYGGLVLEQQAPVPLATMAPPAQEPTPPPAEGTVKKAPAKKRAAAKPAAPVQPAAETPPAEPPAEPATEPAAPPEAEPTTVEPAPEPAAEPTPEPAAEEAPIEPTPEPAPEPAPVPAPETEPAVAEAPAEDPAAPAEAPVEPEGEGMWTAPDGTTHPLGTNGLARCAQCAGDVASQDQVDLGFIRYRKPYCRPCFASQGKK